MNLTDEIMYQFYPLGCCGAAEHNEWFGGYAEPYPEGTENRIGRLADWIPHLQRLGISSVYFGPVFQSDQHGYDTRDYFRIDCRLGTNKDFAELCESLHKAGIKIVLDAVFNHVGRGFWAFRDLQQNKQSSPYKDWFYLDFNKDSPSNDGFYYEAWEGHYSLVKLNLKNPEVREHLFDAVSSWMDQFAIDGLRLDVAYCMDESFLASLHKRFPELTLIGEIVHGDYNRIVNDQMLDSCTNYELYKGLYSSFNDLNMFELAHTLKRQSSLYKGKMLMSFVDNHDVTRLASILDNPDHLHLVYGLLYSLKGYPCLYYGSEWGTKGKKEQGDAALRPAFEKPEWNELCVYISQLAQTRKREKALQYGILHQLFLTNRQLIFERSWTNAENGANEQIIVAVNASDTIAHIQKNEAEYGRFIGIYGKYRNVLSGEQIELHGDLDLAASSISFWKKEV